MKITLIVVAATILLASTIAAEAQQYPAPNPYGQYGVNGTYIRQLPTQQVTRCVLVPNGAGGFIQRCF